MTRAPYSLVCETTEDRLDEASSLSEAIEIARGRISEVQVGEPILIEHHGMVILQLIRTEEGEVVEEAIM